MRLVALCHLIFARLLRPQLPAFALWNFQRGWESQVWSHSSGTRGCCSSRRKSGRGGRCKTVSVPNTPHLNQQITVKNSSRHAKAGVRRKSAKMCGNDFCDLTIFFFDFFLTFSIPFPVELYTVVLLKEVPEGVENGQNALNKRCRTYPL